MSKAKGLVSEATRVPPPHPITRGIRNNNPGNLECSADAWRGLATHDEMTPEQQDEDRFCVFRAPEWGIRAMLRTLRSYQRRHHLHTTREMIYRWAPPGGKDNNHTEAYVKAVAASLGNSSGVGDPAEIVVDLSDMDTAIAFMAAMIRVENGWQPYRRSVLIGAWQLAGA